MQDIVTNDTVLFYLALAGALGTMSHFLILLFRLVKKINEFIRWEGMVAVVFYGLIVGTVYLTTDSLVVTLAVVAMLNVLVQMFLREIVRLING